MNNDLHHDHQTLDSRAFALVLCAIFACTIVGLAASIVTEAPASSSVIAAAPSQLQCPCL